MSKGSKQRPTDKKAFESGYELIFGKTQVIEPSKEYNESLEAGMNALSRANQTMQEINETITEVHTLQ